jgi:hypothetical protein
MLGRPICRRTLFICLQQQFDEASQAVSESDARRVPEPPKLVRCFPGEPSSQICNNTPSLPFGRWWLPLPYPLLLLYMSLLQLLRLLLMALLDLLFPRLIGILPLHPLVFLILFPLKLLPFLLLLSKHFLLLLLVFPVFRRSGMFK